MPTYITLLNYTAQGVSKVKESPKRLDAGRKAFAKFGVQIKDTYLLMGRYDLLCVVEAPDDDALAKAMLTLGSQGNIKSETLKAWDEEGFRRVIKSL
jgi:uncharacterized protein with GYD domain